MTKAPKDAVPATPTRRTPAPAPRQPAKKTPAAKTAGAAAAKKTPAKSPAAPRSRTTRAAAQPPGEAQAQARPGGPPPGWYADPADLSVKKFWDGEGWVGEPVPAATDTTGFGPMLAPGDASARTEPAAQAAGSVQPTGTILFHGRQLTVRLPTVEQLLVFQRVGKELETLSATPIETIDVAKLARAAGRALKIIDSLLPVAADREWLEDLYLNAEINLFDATQILTDTVKLMPKLAAQAASETGRNRPKARLRR